MGSDIVLNARKNSVEHSRHFRTDLLFSKANPFLPVGFTDHWFSSQAVIIGQKQVVTPYSVAFLFGIQ